MSTNTEEQLNEFSVQATERYDTFIAWMINHWPQQSDRLTVADFSAGKREMGLLLGAKLHVSRGDNSAPLSDIAVTEGESDSKQYLPVTPAPWP